MELIATFAFILIPVALFSLRAVVLYCRGDLEGFNRMDRANWYQKLQAESNRK